MAEQEDTGGYTHQYVLSFSDKEYEERSFFVAECVSTATTSEQPNEFKKPPPKCLVQKASELNRWELSIFAKVDIPVFVRFGPLVGQAIKPQDAPVEFYRDGSIWKTFTEGGVVKALLLTNQEIWYSSLRLSQQPTRPNLVACDTPTGILFYTIGPIKAGEEILCTFSRQYQTNLDKMATRLVAGMSLVGNFGLGPGPRFGLRPSFGVGPQPILGTHATPYGMGRPHSGIRQHSTAIDVRGSLLAPSLGGFFNSCGFPGPFFNPMQLLADMGGLVGSKPPVCVQDPSLLRQRPTYGPHAPYAQMPVASRLMPDLLGGQGPPHRCTDCQENFSNEISLKVHKKHKHPKVRKFHCAVCDKRFIQKNHLETHMLIHQGKKPFTCEACPASFRSINNLNTHQLRHEQKQDPNLRYTCKICGEAFLKLLHMQFHRLVHKDSAAFLRCPQCSKRCANMDVFCHHLSEGSCVLEGVDACVAILKAKEPEGDGQAVQNLEDHDIEEEEAESDH